MKKICNSCNQEKEITSFKKCKVIKSGYASICLECHNQKSKDRYHDPKNHSKYLQYHRDRSKTLEYKIKKKLYDKEYKYKNKKMLLKQRKKRFEVDFEFKLNFTIGNAIRKSLKGTKKKHSWRNLVNYTLQDLKKHLELLFEEGMSWENYGLGYNKSYRTWHIDHIKPKSLFKFESFEDDAFKKCWALSNLQPLWEDENFRKGNFYEEDTYMSVNKFNELAYLPDSDRLKAYETITNGAMHLWSKGKLQEDKFLPIMDTFINLAENDPLFLAHFTSYVVRNLDSKDLRVVALYASSLSDADGTPFRYQEKGAWVTSQYKKPNLRQIAHAGLQMMDIPLALRILELANFKSSLGKGKFKNKAAHYPRSLRNAVIKYLRYREENLQMVKGIQKAGLSRKFKQLYRFVRIAPSYEAAGILRWDQKKGPKIQKAAPLDFKGMSDIEIAQKIQNEKIKPMLALGALPDKISPVIAAALLEQATGNQAVILTSLFEEQGLLKNKEVKKIYAEKVATAKDALDRVERINKVMNSEVKAVLDRSKSEQRKNAMGEIGSIFLHIDISSSMNHVIQFVKEKGAIIAECIKNPEKNFHWGVFNGRGKVLDTPKEFTQGAFMAALYGTTAGGQTDCLACYPESRKLNCDVDIFITDQEHNGISFENYFTGMKTKPRSVVIVHFPGDYRKGEDGPLYKAFVEQQIPVAILDPRVLSESALVVQAIKSATLGSIAIIDQIMETPLLKLPTWWESVKSK